MTNILQYNTAYFLRYSHPRYVKYLFTNMQKQQNMLKNSPGSYMNRTYSEIFKSTLVYL